VEDLSEKLNRLVLVHSLMQRAVLGITLSGLPALLMLAAVDAKGRRLVLSEVKSLRWVNLAAHCQLEVLVRNFSVFVKVELIEDQLELLVVDLQAPVLEVKS